MNSLPNEAIDIEMEPEFHETEETKPNESSQTGSDVCVTIHSNDPSSLHTQTSAVEDLVPAAMNSEISSIIQVICRIALERLRSVRIGDSSTSSPIIIDDTSNFFEAGGTSDDVVFMVSQLRTELAFDNVSAADIFQNPTPKQLAVVIQKRMRGMDSEEKEIEEDNAEEAGDHIVDGEEARFSAQLSRTASHVRFEPPSKLHDPNNTVPPTSSTIRTFRASSSFHTSKFHTSREPSVRLWRSSNKPISPQNAGAGGTALPSEGETFTRFQIPSWWKYVQLFYMLLMWTTFGGSLAVAYAITDFITTDTDQFLGSLYLMLCVRTCVFSVLVAVSLVLMIKVWKVVWDSLCGGPIVAGVVESSSWLHRSREWFLSTYWDVMGVILSPLHGTPLMSVLLRFLGAHIGSDVDVYSNGFDLAAIHLVHIGDDAFIGHSASISTLSVDRRRGTIIGMVTIIGSECVVEEQAEIGTGAVLGERCLVKPLSVVSGQSPSCVRWSAREGVYDESLERKPSTVLSSPPPRRTLFQHLFLLVFILCVGVASLQPAVFVQWIYWNNETVQTQLVDPNRDRQPATWFFHEHMPILRFALFPAWILIWSVWGCIASIILIRLTASVAHLLCPLTQQPCSDATFLHPGSDLSVANSGCRVPLHSWQFLLWSWCRQTISSLHPYTAVLMPMSLLHFYYRACGATIHHKSLIIGPPSAMRMPHHLLTVERDAMITNGPVLGAMEVDVQTRCVKMGPITVREGSLIANHAILHPCIDIPAHSTVAPMAIVSPATFQTDIEQSASQSKSMQSKSNLLSPTPLKSNLGNKSTNASPIHAKTDEVRVGMRPLFIGAPASISQFRPNLSESVGLRSLQDDKESFRLWWPLVHLCGLCIVIFWAAIWSICFLPGMLFIDALHAPLGRNTSLSLLLLVPVAYLIIVCCVLLAFIAVKWIVLGRYESGKKGHFRSIWFMKYIMSHVAGTRSPLSLNFIAPYMAGTEWYVMYIRCLGAKIGKNGYFGDFTILSDYDLHDIGDDVVMTAGANPFCHYFDRGLMSFDRITTGNDVTVSGSAHVLPGVSLGAGSYIESRTVIMRGETIPPGTRWAGSPAKCLTVRHPAASMPTPPRSIPSITGSASSVAAMSESIRSFLFPFEASPKPSAPQSTNVPPAHTLIDRLSSEGSSTCSSSSSSVAPPPASIPASSSVSINMTAEEAGALAHRLSVSLLPVDIGTSALGCWDMLPDPVTGHRDSILDLIYHHVKTQPWSPCMTWVNEKGHDEMTLTYQQFWDAALAVATQITSKLAGLKSPSKKSHSDTVGAPLPQFPPQVDVGSLGIDRPRVILCYAFDLNFIVGFIGTLLAGAIAVPVYTPDPSSIKRSLTKLNAIVKACGAQLALTNTTFNRFRVVSSIITSGSDVNSAWPASLQWIVTDCAPKKNRKLQWTFENTPAFGKIEPNHILFLQFTSGSTGTPKGVCISARNVFHNCYGIHRDFLRAHKGRPMIMCSWLPPFHDFGLIAQHLVQLCSGSRGYFFSPFAFLSRPMIWPETISRVRATITGSPNFGLELVTRKYRAPPLSSSSAPQAKLDLSCVRNLMFGSEPCRVSTFDGFLNIFANQHGLDPLAIETGYGLAEHVFGMSKLFHPRAGESPRTFVTSSQHPHLLSMGDRFDVDQVDLRIVNPSTCVECSNGTTGEIWLSSPSKACAYWNSPSQSEETFHAKLLDVDAPSYTFLRTGDEGYVLDGHLYITGRLKDMIIHRGEKYYPQDIELTVMSAHPNVRPGCVAAFAVDQSELPATSSIKRDAAVVPSTPITPPVTATSNIPLAAATPLPAGSTTPSGELLTIVCEVREPCRVNADYMSMASEIASAVRKEHGLPIHYLAFLKARSIAKTSSGKIARSESRTRLRQAQYNILFEYCA